MPACPAFDPLAPYIPSVVDFVDCHARALGEDGYRALGAGSPIGIAITGLITIYVALIGYRMLLGETPTIRDAVLAAVRIGMVLALATQWPAYQILVYDIVVDEPAALSVRILAPGGLGGDSAQSLVNRTQGAYDVLQSLAYPDPAAQNRPLPQSLPTPGAPSAPGPLGAAQPFPPALPQSGLTVAQRSVVATASSMVLIGSLAGLLSTRVIAALLLALGPIFIGCFLFEAMRGLFVSWVRALIGVVIGAIGVVALLSLELAILEPQVRALAQAVDAGDFVPALSGEILATSIIFALVMAAMLAAATFAAAGLRLPDTVRHNVLGLGDPEQPRPLPAMARADAPAGMLLAQVTRSRPQMIADAAASMERRDLAAISSWSGGSRTAVAERHETASRTPEPPLGQSGRRSNRRHSASAARRDSRA